MAAPRKRKRKMNTKGVVRVQYREGEDGFVIAECPDLPGCMSQGRTLSDARKNIRDAIEGWLEVHKGMGLPSPVSELIKIS